MLTRPEMEFGGFPMENYNFASKKMITFQFVIIIF